MRYTLKHPVPFTVGELRLLAPVADPRRVLIAVEQVCEGTQRRLQIYGLIDTGMALWEMARHERGMGIASPEAFVVATTQPGELIISRGDHPVIRMRAGEVVSPAGSILFRGPVARFFSKASDELIQEACERSGVVQDPAEDDGLILVVSTVAKSQSQIAPIAEKIFSCHLVTAPIMAAASKAPMTYLVTCSLRPTSAIKPLWVILLLPMQIYFVGAGDVF